MHIGKILNLIYGSGDSRTRIVVKNALGSFVIKVFAMGIDFAKVPVLLTFLEPKYYGVYITIASIVAWTHRFDFGLGSGLRYQLTKSISQNDNIKGKQLVSTAYISMSAIMLCVLLICVPIALFLDWRNILNCDFIGSTELKLCVCMVLAVFVVQFVLELISVVLQADQKAAISSIFKPLANLLTLALILILRRRAHNSLMLACLAMTVPIAMVLLITNIIYFLKQYNSIAPSFRDFNRQCISDIYSLGVKYFSGQVSALVVFSTASFLISHYINSTEAAVYNAAWMYFGVLVMFNSMVLNPLVAAVTDAYVKNEDGWIHSIFKKIRLYSCMLTVASLCLLAISQLVFKWWLRGRLEIPWSLSIVMTAYFICNIWITPYKNFLSGVGKMNVTVILSICKIILFFPVAITLIKIWGTIGLLMAIIFINTLPNMILGVYQYHLIMSHKAKGIWNQ